MATTKYDLFQEAEKEKAKRLFNIKTLDAQINEAKTLLSVMPNITDIKSQRERQVVQARIKALNDMRADEQRAYDEASNASDADAQKAFLGMGI